jgi:hypothetical protein
MSASNVCSRASRAASLSQSRTTPSSRLERLGELAERCLVLVSSAMERQSPSRSEIRTDLAAATSEAKQFIDQAPTLRAFNNSPVVCAGVIEASAAEAAIRLAEHVLDRAAAHARDETQGDSAPVAGSIKQLTPSEILYLLAQVRQEIAKAARRERRKKIRVRRTPVTDPCEGPTGAQVALEPYVFRLVGDVWQVRFGPKSELKLFRDSVGMSYIHRLLAHRDRPLNALHVVHGRTPGVANERSTTKAEPGKESAGTAQPQAAFDDEAQKVIRRQLNKLQDQIDEAKEFNDEAEQVRLERERSRLLKHWDKDRGLGGRPRSIDHTHAEKARQAVRQALTRAYKQLEKGSMNELAEHLREAIDTGKHCVYRPDPNFPCWTL